MVIEAKGTANWVELEGYDGYEISRGGEVSCSEKTVNTKDRTYTASQYIVTPFNHPKSNAQRVYIRKNGKRVSRGVTMLMLDTFFNRRDGYKYEVYYRDKNTDNNALWNLTVNEVKI